MVACTKSDLDLICNLILGRLQTGHGLTMSSLGKGELTYWQSTRICKQQLMQLGLHHTAWMEPVPSRADGEMLLLTVGVCGAVLQRKRGGQGRCAVVSQP